MKLYLENGYVNIPEVMKLPVTFIWCFGGRGTGKTYGALKYAIETQGAAHPFFHFRRRDKEIKMFKRFNPFTKLNNDMNWDMQFRMSGDLGEYINEQKQVVGKVGAISTFYTTRGLDADNCNLIFFDEFIPERQSPWIKGEADAFFQSYETINRNRELEGRPPVKVLCAANANDAANPYFLSLNVITTVEKMKRDKKEIYVNKEHEFALINLETSPISELKKDTVLYKMTRGSDFEKMSIYNSFAFDDFSNIHPCDLKPYIPVVAVGEITIYKHKAEQKYYVSEHRSGAPALIGTSERELEYFKTHYWRLYNKYIDGHVVFENYLTKTLFCLYYK